MPLLATIAMMLSVKRVAPAGIVPINEGQKEDAVGGAQQRSTAHETRGGTDTTIHSTMH